jgi:hypothetical protein
VHNTTSKRAMRGAPITGRNAAQTFPPPSLTSTASGARSAAIRSSRNAKDQKGGDRRRIEDQGSSLNPGAPPCWPVFCLDLAMIDARIRLEVIAKWRGIEELDSRANRRDS